jgi:hypothetical protein
MEQDALCALLSARNYTAIVELMERRTPFADSDVELIARSMVETEFGQLTLTRGWWPLAKTLLPRSRTLREHAFAILGRPSTANVGDAYRKTDRSNLLIAVGRLDLTADEIALLRQLRNRISPSVYKEDVDAILFKHSTRDEQIDTLMQIWTKNSPNGTTGGAIPPALVKDAKDEHDDTQPVSGIENSGPTDSTITESRERAWLLSPFRILVCMPFRVPEISRVWSDRICPALEDLGNVLRLDWSTDDWVRDIRRISDEAAFVVVDVSSMNTNVRRELAHLIRQKIPCICYASKEGGNRISTVGKIHPMLARDGSNIDPGVWGQTVHLADYGSKKEVGELVELLVNRIRPFCDIEDPTGSYVGSDLSLLPEVERRGFHLARAPRSRVSAEKLAKDGKELIWDSAIFRARVFSWLANKNLMISSPENLWLREHLLWIVRGALTRGYRVTSSESKILTEYLKTETSESIRNLGADIGSLIAHARIPSPAEKCGLPAVPMALPEKIYSAPVEARLYVKLTEEGPVGLRATEWSRSFIDGASGLRRLLSGQAGPISNRHIFTLDGDSESDPRFAGVLGDIEDALDSIVKPLSALVLNLVKDNWPHEDIEEFLQTTVALSILRELRRRGVYDLGEADVEHQRLAREIGYIWSREAREIRLFEFQARSTRKHFRGLFPWIDVKERAMRVYAADASEILNGEIPEDDIFEQAMATDYLPAQIWDAMIRPRMDAAASPDEMRRLWATYVLPTAFLYWQREAIYSDPIDTEFWCYVLS